MRTLLLVLLLASTTWAGPRRDGANHHLGDDSFVAAFGRAPTPRDPETLRMHTHLAYVRTQLAAHPATRPELASRRAELLGYLDDYIRAGITPRNTYLAQRNPVFIDAEGRICAVGYLIERSVGRALPEAIAATHRLDYLEDIAAAMPDVAAWVAGSGFTLDELASIQPGYHGPDVMHADGFVADAMKADGSYKSSANGVTMTGAFAKRAMTGDWKLTDDKTGRVLGRGRFRRGSGTWTSFYADGKQLASGDYDNSRAEGTWKIYHPSGRLAASGNMHHGRRDGAWTFRHDVPGSPVLSTGTFDKGETVGPWKHYDTSGKLVATASGHPWGHLLLGVEPGKDGIRHEIDQGEPAERYRLDAFYTGSERLYIRDRSTLYDGNGAELEKVDGTWQARACTWSKARLRAARAGDTTTLYNSLTSEHWKDAIKAENGGCDGPPTPVGKARAATIEKVLASRGQIHAPLPAGARKPPTPDSEERTSDGEATPYGTDNEADFATYLADHMTWYMEWPHVDQLFVAMYASLPGHRTVEDEFADADMKQMH